MEKKESELVIYGAGAIGATIGGLISRRYKKISLLGRGEHAKVMKSKGLTLYQLDSSKSELFKVDVINDLKEKPSTDIVIVVVKNFGLEIAAKDIKIKLGDKPIIVSLQNGAENQKILPKYFSKVIYGVIWFGAWLDKPGVIGYEQVGPITLGVLKSDSKLQAAMEEISRIFNEGGVITEIIPSFQDAVHTKIIFNITNALLTLIGQSFREITSIDKLRKITVNLLNEGIDIVEAAGYKEFMRGENHPTWKLLRIARKLPGIITNKIFLKFINNVNLNSMAQDVITLRREQNELDSLNGYLLELAEKYGVPAPYNRALYEACKEQFALSPFKPLTEEELWQKVQINLKKMKKNK